jgi:protein-disulfide isomerase
MRFPGKIFSLLAGVTLLLQTSQALAAAGAPAANTPVAVIGDEHVTLNQLPNAEKDLDTARERYEQQRHQLDLDYERARQSVIEQHADMYIDDSILRKEAQARHVTVPQLLAELKNPEVTGADVQAFYEQNKSDINRPLDQVSEAIKQFLTKQAAEDGKRAYLVTLRTKYSARTAIEPLREQVVADGPTRGPDGARVTIVEFADFQCPFCRRMYPVLKQVLEKHPADVRLVFRELPLTELHPNALGAARAALCARDQGKFWEMHDALFADLDGLDAEGVKKAAARVGLQAQPFADCLVSDKTKASIEADTKAAAQYGVNATPGLFVNGRFFSGAMSYGAMEAAIEDELARAKGQTPRVASRSDRR